MMLVRAPVDKKNFIIGKVFPGEDLGCGVENVGSSNIVVRDVNLRIASIQGQRTPKLRDSQLASAGREFQLVAGRRLTGVVGMSHHKEGRGRVPSNKWRNRQIGCIGVHSRTGVLWNSVQIGGRSSDKVSDELQLAVLLASDVSRFRDGTAIVVRGVYSGIRDVAPIGSTEDLSTFVSSISHPLQSRKGSVPYRNS